MAKSFFAAVLDCLFPPLCHICKSFIPDAGEVHVCEFCRQRMPLIVSPLCTQCGTPYLGVGGDHLCGSCIQDQPHFDAARAAFAYEGPCREMIHSFKYHNKIHLRRPLALLTIDHLAGFITPLSVDLVIPVPLHRARLRSRGFNQAVLLGEVLARRMNIPLDRDNLKRTRWTEPQVNLAAEARKTNVKGAFSVQQSARLHGRRVVLVDDVLTTGSTVNECSRVLKSAGAAGVSVITVARALAA